MPRLPSSSQMMGPLLILLLLSWPVPGAAALQGELRFVAAREEPAWVGQEMELYLELWSDALSFGDQRFALPEVPGGFLLQGDSSTVKLSEVRDGTAWQGLRYTLLFYPQAAGRLEVPPFEVRFTARAGFGSEAEPFRFTTEPLTLEARLPEGVRSAGLLVTTASFSMEASWSRNLPSSGPLQMQTGDALTLEVRRRAEEVPGMVFPPLSAPKFDGLGVYPAAPVVQDSVNRGALTGARTDAITFVCEAAGGYTIPEWRFQWWDPQREVLAERVIPALQVEVAANPAYAGESGRSVKKPSWQKVLPLLIAGAMILAVGWFAARPLAALVRSWAQRHSLKRTGPDHRSGLLLPLNPRS